jgi:hypothetical protein
VTESGEGAEAVKIWCVCDSVKGDVESYHPSYAWAMERIEREASARPVSVQAYRVVTIGWERYRTVLTVAAESHDFILREGLVRHAALGLGRSRQVARAEMKQFKAVATPIRRLPAHALDVPELIAISADDYGPGPDLSRQAAFQQAAETNRRYLLLGAAWDGQWCLVVELGNPLEGTWVASEFAGPLGVESRITRRPLRLVRPTEAELAQLACQPAVG